MKAAQAQGFELFQTVDGSELCLRQVHYDVWHRIVHKKGFSTTMTRATVFTQTTVLVPIAAPTVLSTTYGALTRTTLAPASSVW